MTDFAGLLEDFGRNTEKMIVPSQAKRKAMTAAGATVYTEALKKKLVSVTIKLVGKLAKLNTWLIQLRLITKTLMV